MEVVPGETAPADLRAEGSREVYVSRLSEPIDVFDGLTPLHKWLDGDADRVAWALKAVLALAESAQDVGWQGDMRHMPMVGYLPTSPSVSCYLVVKQDNNGDTFMICETGPSQLVEGVLAFEAIPGRIGSWTPPTRLEMAQEMPMATSAFSEPVVVSADDGEPPF